MPLSITLTADFSNLNFRFPWRFEKLGRILLYKVKLCLFPLQVACTLVAVLLHYFLLVTFAWMLVEGVYLYIMVITVFENSKEQLRVYGACAYGKPIH